VVKYNYFYNAIISLNLNNNFKFMNMFIFAKISIKKEYVEYFFMKNL